MFNFNLFIMKKFLLIFASILMLISCNGVVFDDGGSADNAKTKKFTFTMKGDFSNEWKPVTRGYLATDGRDLTDVWVLDYKDGVLVQQLHQDDNTAEDFGRPVMNLTMGSHHIYFVASRGTSPVLTTNDHTVTFAKPNDTFWKDYAVEVVPTSNGNRAVTLDRVATKMRLTFTDEIPAGAASFVITPATWYYGIDYISGLPCAPASSQPFTVTIPANYIGTTGTFVTVYGISPAEEWQTDIAVSAKNGNSEAMGAVTITDAPFKANRATEYAGPLFGSSGSLTLSLNAEWQDSYTGEW